MRGNFFIPPRKTSGLRSARPKKKPPSRATISVLVPIWWLCIPKLEPILARSANEAPAPARASTRCAPPENPSLELSNEFPPPIFYFLAERAGFSGGSPTASGGGAGAKAA
jgi:hypothetical protein